MKELTELEIHRRLISAQIKREIKECKDGILSRTRIEIDSLSDRLQDQQKAINAITERLMDLALYENKLINRTEDLIKYNELIRLEIHKLKELVIPTIT